jgi:hypothetical protein
MRSDGLRSGLAALMTLVGACGRTPTTPDPLRERVIGVTVVDEHYLTAALALRQLETAPHPTLDTVAIEETLPALLPYYVRPQSRVPLPPDIEGAYLDFVTRVTFVTHPIPYTRAFVARVRAVGSLRRAESISISPNRVLAFLHQVAELDDTQLTEYQFLADETGTPPAKSSLRRLALTLLARRGGDEIRSAGRIVHANDDEEILLELPTLTGLGRDAGFCGSDSSYFLLPHVLADVPRGTCRSVRWPSRCGLVRDRPRRPSLPG